MDGVMSMNTKNNWGPYAKLARQIHYFSTNPDYKNFECLEAANQYGGLWGLYGNDIWPESLASEEYRPKKNFWSALRNLKFLFFQKKIESESCTPDDLAMTLATCHAWLEKRNLRRLMPLVKPLWNETPVEFISVSEKAVVWALISYLIDEYGPESVGYSGIRSFVKRYALDSDAKQGDYLALHFNIEDIVESLEVRLNANGHRKPGGLRRYRFLEIYPALFIVSEKRRAVIKMLVDNSPLTQIVYADVIRGFESSIVLDPIINPGKASKINDDEIPDRKGWHELWLSHLARSLIGVILSPPPTFEEWKDAEDKRQHIELKGKIWKSKKSHIFKIVQYPGLAAARDRENKLKQEMENQYIERIGIFARLLRESVFLKLRVLDMLIRHIATISSKAMKEQWEEGDLVYRNRNMVFLGKDSVCFQSLYEILFGRKWKDGSHRNGDESLQERLRELLEPPLNDSKTEEKIIEYAGISKDSAQRMMTRYFNEKESGVELPFGSFDNRGLAPSKIYIDWLVIFQNAFSEDKEASEEI
jgi:hypothetical protein